MKKVNQTLNIIMGAFVGVFVGYCIYFIWNFKTHPELYALQSAPWYTSILVHGVVTLAVIALCFLLKAILKHFAKKADNKPTE